MMASWQNMEESLGHPLYLSIWMNWNDFAMASLVEPDHLGCNSLSFLSRRCESWEECQLTILNPQTCTKRCKHLFVLLVHVCLVYIIYYINGNYMFLYLFVFKYWDRFFCGYHLQPRGSRRTDPASSMNAGMVQPCLMTPEYYMAAGRSFVYNRFISP